MSLRTGLLITVLLAAFMFASGCSTSTAEATEEKPLAETLRSAPQPAAPKGPSIAIEPGSPAETVREFYRRLREKRFRDAIVLTNLRPAIEGLTDNELRDFQVDLEAVAKTVPSDIEINGEIITGEQATVTARLPGDDPQRPEIQEIRLRRENGIWVILSAEGEAEKAIRREGRNYFYALRIETHQSEARAMMERIAKAQMVFRSQNQGRFTTIPMLVGAGLLPEDVQTSASTGYVYTVELLDGDKNYRATAHPAEYAKTGKLVFQITLKNGSPVMTSRDGAAKPPAK
jgi:hypothetical protein